MHFHIPRVKSFSDVVQQVHDVMRQYKHEKESEAHQVRSTVLAIEFMLMSANRFFVNLQDITSKVLLLKPSTPYVAFSEHFFPHCLNCSSLG